MPRKKNNIHSNWKAILDLCDELSALKEKLDEREETPSVRRKLRGSMQEIVKDIARRMSKEARFGVLAPMAARLALKPNELAVIALLLSRFVAYNTPEIEGRELLNLLFDSSYSKLQGISLLESKALLRAAGLVECEAPEKGSDPLDSRFRLSDKIVRALCEAGIAHPRDYRPASRRTYHNNREYLLDLKALKSLYHQRAVRLFDPERVPFTEAGRAEIQVLGKRIVEVRRRILETLEASPEAAQFTAVRFQHEFGLCEEETLIVVSLLFQELLEGEAYADAVDLLKLVSSDEESVIRNRKFFRPGSSLLRHNIVQLEDMVAEKAMTAEVVLSNWVVERLLGEERSERAIAPDEKIDFHNYLKNLDSAETFLRDLTRENES